MLRHIERLAAIRRAHPDGRLFLWFGNMESKDIPGRKIYQRAPFYPRRFNAHDFSIIGEHATRIAGPLFFGWPIRERFYRSRAFPLVFGFVDTDHNMHYDEIMANGGRCSFASDCNTFEPLTNGEAARELLRMLRRAKATAEIEAITPEELAEADRRLAETKNAPPLSDELIESIVRYATDPEN